MNIRPPRATDDRNVDSVPNVNARIRNSEGRNIGCAERRSTATNATMHASEHAGRIRTRALPHPVATPPAGRIPHVTAIIARTRPSANVALPGQSMGSGRGVFSSRRRR